MQNHPTQNTFLGVALIGLIINYFLGTNYMYFAYKFTASAEYFPYSVVWGWMVAPFFKDLLLTLLVAIIAPRLRKIV